MGVISKMTTNKTYGQIIKEARISYLTSASTFSTKGEEDEFIAKAVIQAFCARNAEAVYQWRRIGYDAWHDATKEEAYSRVDEYYEARTLFLAPQPLPSAGEIAKVIREVETRGSHTAETNSLKQAEAVLTLLKEKR